jgi:hypothetical protein
MVMRTKERLTVEAAVEKINEDYAYVKRRLSLSSSILTSGNILKIEKEIIAMGPEIRNKNYTEYELGFRFIIDHIIGQVKKLTALSEEEENNTMAIFGRVYYNPPDREYERRATAAEEFAKKEDRSLLILQYIRDGFNSFIEIREMAYARPHEFTDTFLNPENRIFEIVRTKNFDSFAKNLRRSIAFEGHNSDASFYI